MPRKSTTHEFINKAKLKHGDRYLYDKVLYVGSLSKVIVTCCIHDDFLIKPNCHLNGRGCPKCGKIKSDKSHTRSKSEFVRISNIKHNNTYTYEKFLYINSYTKGNVTCVQHGNFPIVPKNHLEGKGCPKCGLIKNSKSRTMIKSEFVRKAHLKHNNTYTYDNFKYINTRTKSFITCLHHGDFPITPNNHLNGSGCPICNLSKGELEIMKLFQKYDITFVHQKRFPDCKNKQTLPFDFYLPYFYMLIEYDGIQHFKPIKRFGGQKTFKEVQHRDKIKDEFCKKKRIPLIRIPYNKNIEQCLKDAGIL